MRLNPLDTALYALMRVIHAFDRRERDLKDFDPRRIRNILVVSSTAIGDTLLSTPAVRAVRESYPRAHVTALFNKDNMELFANNPHIDDVLPYHGGYRKFIRTVLELRRRRFDLVLIFHGNEPQTTPLAYLSGAPFIFKLPNESRFRFLLSNREPVTRWDGLGHGIEARLRVAGLAGCETDDMRMELFIDRADDEAAGLFLENETGGAKTLVGFQPGASTVSRMWFPGRFIEVGRRIVDDFDDAVIVLTGSPAERALCEEIAGGIGRNTLVTAGRIPLRRLPPLIKRLSVFVTGDTGPMHIAYALGTPVVALYAVADPARTGPLYDRSRHIVIKKPRTCDPCAAKKCEYQECMEQITVEEVWRAVNELLERSHTKKECSGKI